MKILDKFLKKNREEYSVPKDQIDAADIIAPSLVEVKQDYLKLGDRMARSYFIFSYPRYLSAGWLSPLVNTVFPMDISFHLHPIDSPEIMKKLRRKVTEIQAEIMEKEEKGITRDPELEIANQNLEELRDKLQTAQERMFRLGLYITIYGDTENELRTYETELRSILESRLIYIKPALHKQKDGFATCAPYDMDKLMITTLMNTAPLSSSFPFISFDLSSNEGILYGINRHNNSLILFDRFSLPNANEVVFGITGGGKSYAVKLEALRYLMMGVDVMIIDPENEYKFLAEAIGGSFIEVSLGSEHHLNPFDLPKPREDENADDVLRNGIINLVGLFRIMLGNLTPEEDSIIDKALAETYAAKDITADSDPNLWGEPEGLPFPIMSDFEEVISSMEGTESLARRIQRFTQGAYSQFFNQQSNVDLSNRLVVFGIRNMEDELRPMALYVVLKYVWKTVVSSLKKRILVIDEAWLLMQKEDGASFLFGTIKRARKYWLGVTVINQDVNDFMRSAYGQPLVNNSSLQILFKQNPSAIELVQKTFNLTEAEKLLLLETPVGEGIFIAGLKHVLMRTMASYTENQIITTAPEEVAKIKEARRKIIPE